MDKLISVIIVTYNSDKYIFDCLDSIFKHNDIGDKLEVIVVDNCSDNVDHLFSRIELIYGDKINLIQSRVNGGYGHGNNQGINASCSSHCIVMNPDVRLVKPIFRSIIEIFNSKSDIGIVGVRFVDGSVPIYFKPEYSSLFRMIFGRSLVKLRCYSIREVFFSGSFLAIDKVSFIKAGMFDENIFMYHEEADISNRMFLIGKGSFWAENIPVLHLAHGRKLSVKLIDYGNESRSYYFKKYNLSLESYYKRLLLYYKLKLFIAKLLKDTLKIEEFSYWIQVCKSKGKSF